MRRGVLMFCFITINISGSCRVLVVGSVLLIFGFRAKRRNVCAAFGTRPPNPLSSAVGVGVVSLRDVHAKILRSVSQAGGQVPARVRLAHLSDRKLRRFHP